jgi:catechol 2,3-dioxygenase-like lactoylglutathione lyase family enzyme
MKIEWQPDADNIYLTSGHDNLALHRATEKAAPRALQKLDHIGFIINTPEEVDEWHTYLSAHQVPITKEPKTHRDGARSFYCADPDSNSVQLIYHPPLSQK